MPKMIPRWPKNQQLTAAWLHQLYKIIIEGEYQDGTKMTQRLNIDSWMVVLIWCKSNFLTCPRWYQDGPNNQQLTAAWLHQHYTSIIEGECQDGTKMDQRLNNDSWMVVLIWCKGQLLACPRWYQDGQKSNNWQLHDYTNITKPS